MASSSKAAVLTAVVGNGLLTVIKFIAFASSGSGAMFSEGMHSLADTANQVLLLVGIRSSERPPDAMFPYGYGRDRYFFSLMSAVGVFVLGCGVTLYHGVHTILEPEPIGDIRLSVGVLVVSFIVEGFVLAAALRAVNVKRAGRPFFTYLRNSSDPTVLAILLEDSVACLGVVVALAAIVLTKVTGNPIYDSLGTLAIGGMLGGIAVWLGLKNRTLLIGPAARHVRGEILDFLDHEDGVLAVRSAKTRVLGADRLGLTADIEFDGAYVGRKLTPFVEASLPTLDTPEGREAFAGEFGAKLIESLGDEVDAIEARLVARFPDLHHVDLEAD